MICPASIEIEPRSVTDLQEYNTYLVFEILIWILLEFNQSLMYRKFWSIIQLSWMEMKH